MKIKKRFTIVEVMQNKTKIRLNLFKKIKYENRNSLKRSFKYYMYKKTLTIETCSMEIIDEQIARPW